MQNANFWHFQVSLFQDSKGLGFSSWFVSSSGLVLHKSNVRRSGTLPGSSGRASKQGIKPQFSTSIYAAVRHAHTRRSGHGSKFLARVSQ